MPARLTLTLTPILIEQLADAQVRENFLAYLDEKIAPAEADIPRFEKAGDSHFSYLAGFYRDWYRGIRRSFVERYDGNLVPAFRKLQDAGIIEIVTCGATHGYLPLLDRDESINLQLKTAVETHRRHFGRAPRAIWLPECAYRPAYFAEDGRQRAGLETFPEDVGQALGRWGVPPGPYFFVLTTEWKIQAALARLLKGRTSFVIAQRISTVMNADQILVLDKGEIVARGTHEELIEDSPIYAEIYSSQLIADTQVDGDTYSVDPEGALVNANPTQTQITSAPA